MLPSILKLAARNLMRHRVRTIISIAAIACGVGSLLLAGGFTEYMFWAMRESAIHAGLGHIQIARPGFREVGLADPYAYRLPTAVPELELIRRAPGVRVVEERLQVSGLASNGETTMAFIGEAVDPAADRVISEGVTVEGKRLAADDKSGVILGRGLAKALGVTRGDRVIFIINLPGGGINAVEGRVRGLFATQVKVYDDTAVRMPLELGRDLLKTTGAHVWVVGLNATEETDEAIAYLRARLPEDRFDVKSWLDLSDFYRKAVVLLSRQIDVVGVLIGIIVVFGIANTLTMSVLERTGEIGTIMAMGTSRASVLRLFILEGLLLGAAGALVGLALGVVLAEIISYVGIPMPPPPGRDVGYLAEIMLTEPLMVWAFFMAIVAATLASIYPARKAAGLPVVDALRHNR
jgi:putative ABC transport system permease protein